MPLHEYIRHRLESHANEMPGAIALSDSTTTLTRENFLVAVMERARTLQEEFASMGDNQFLPVSVERDAESTVTLFACLVAGIPFSPLDSALPPGRVKTVRKLLGNPHTVLTNDHFSPLIDTIARDDKPRGPEADGFHGASRNPPQDEPGMVLMSSGSTGAPKAIAFSWETILNRVRTNISRMESVSEKPVVGLLSPLHFIAGFLFSTLVFAPSRLVVIDPTAITPRELLATLEAHSVTQVTMTPAIARLLSKIVTADTTALSTLKKLGIVGETCRFEYLQGLSQALRPDTQLFQIFGASEAPPSFLFTKDIADLPRSGQVPLGEKADPENTRLEPRESGLYEIWRKGDIASTYLNSPELNNKYFTEDDSGDRWWKSGDLIRQDDTGNWFFHSRMDDTVKIRGLLASPSEATALLNSHDDIEAAVVLVDSTDRRSRFVAHVQLSGGSLLRVEDINRILRDALPDHLVPSRIILHPLLPVTTRGKYDRTALRAFH